MFKKVLVTGSKGFIGSSVYAAYKARNIPVVGIDNFVSNFTQNDSIHVDITKEYELEALKGEKFDTIIHTAASFANQLSVANPKLDFHTNASGTLNLLEFARQTGCKNFVYLGSSSSVGNICNNEPASETLSPSPSTPYAISKYVGELYVSYYKNYFNTWTFRLFNVYGPGDFPGFNRNAIPNMIAAAYQNREMKVFGETSTRDFTFVEDVNNVLMNFEKIPTGLYNICSGKEQKMVEVARIIQSHLEANYGFAAKLTIYQMRDWDKVVRRWGDNRKLTAHMGIDWMPFEQGVKKTIDWVVSVLKNPKSHNLY